MTTPAAFSHTVAAGIWPGWRARPWGRPAVTLEADAATAAWENEGGSIRTVKPESTQPPSGKLSDPRATSFPDRLADPDDRPQLILHP